MRLIQEYFDDLADDKKMPVFRSIKVPSRLKNKFEDILKMEAGCEIEEDQYIHVIDKITGSIIVEIGPQKFKCQEGEEVVYGPSPMVKIPRNHFCVIENPVLVDKKKRAVIDDNGVAKIRHGECEERFCQDPFPLYPGEELKVPATPIKAAAITEDAPPLCDMRAALDERLEFGKAYLSDMHTPRKDSSIPEDKESDATLRLLQGLGFGAETNMYRRIFKISGTIGEGTTKDINYINLCSQINEAKQSGYKSHEIVTAVKKAIAPVSGLRTYFDSQEHISLDSMLQFLRSYFRERSPTELFNELNNMCQRADEEPASFLMRALEIRQKVIIASAAEEDIVHYDKDLIHNMFIHSVRTGLRDDSVRSHMKPFLATGHHTRDDMLIREINIASSEIMERTNKQKQLTQGQRNINANAVSTHQNQGESQQSTEMMKAIASLAEGLAALGKDMAELKKQSSRRNTNSSTGTFNRTSWKNRACQECQQKNVVCTHCWKCGAVGHFSKNCQNKQSSN